MPVHTYAVLRNTLTTHVLRDKNACKSVQLASNIIALLTTVVTNRGLTMGFHFRVQIHTHHSGDRPIHDQNRKLSEILPDFFSPCHILGGRPFKRYTHVITPGSRHVVWIKICDYIPISPEVIDV